MIRICGVQNAVVLELAEELNTEQTVERHEEEEEQRDVVDLLTRSSEIEEEIQYLRVFGRNLFFVLPSINNKNFSLENLIDSRLGHGELEEHSQETNHDERPRRANDRNSAELQNQTEHLEHLKYNGEPEEEYHRRVELAPVILQVRLVPLRNTNELVNIV